MVAVLDLGLEEQADLVERHELGTLLFCHNAWAMRHRFVDARTGEVRGARCDSWHCLYCGPRKVDAWRQLIRCAQPTLFITFTQVGQTVAEASRVLTTIMQYLRRGSRGKGPKRVGARPAYPLEWFATLERHSDFEQVGFHWHVLVSGVDYIAHEHLREALRSASGGRSYIVHVERVRSDAAIGYVTKYLMKDILVHEQGVTWRTRRVRRPVLSAVKSYQVRRRVTGLDGMQQEVMEERPYLFALEQGADGTLFMQEEEEVVECVSKARRIRYSRHFFPLSTKELRRWLFSGRSLEEVQQGLVGEGSEQEMDEGSEAAGKVENQEETSVGGSEWRLVEVALFTRDKRVYEQRRRKMLLEALEEVRAGRKISRRVVGIWSYQQKHQRWRAAG